MSIDSPLSHGSRSRRERARDRAPFFPASRAPEPDPRPPSFAATDDAI